MHQPPRLCDLPSGAPAKHGWPWTESGAQLTEFMPDGRPWPLISVITPSYNQGRYIEETIRSVLLQGYPNYEYVVIDGGSTDGTQEIIAKYAKWLSFWVSEPDRGQAHAINKGLKRITGDIWNFINSDDVLSPDIFQVIGKAHSAFPKAIIVGNVEDFWDSSPNGTVIEQVGIDFRSMVEFWNERASWRQPGIFSPVSLLSHVGILDEELEYALDYDWFCRITSVAQPVYLNRVFARARFHRSSKTINHGYRFQLEDRKVSSRYWSKLADINVPDYIRSSAAFLFRQGCRWIFLERRIEGIMLIKKAFGLDCLGSIILNLKSAPNWLRRHYHMNPKQWFNRVERK